MIVHFVDMDRVVDHHCLNFLFLININYMILVYITGDHFIFFGIANTYRPNFPLVSHDCFEVPVSSKESEL